MITIQDQGSNNQITIHPSYKVANFNLNISGNNNEIIFAAPAHAEPYSHISISVSGDNNILHIGSVFINKLVIHCVNGLKCTIGDRNSFHDAYIATNEPSEVRIGDDCLFANDVRIYPTDFHKILSSGKRINDPEPIVIGNKVWLCERSLILKGAEIGDGSVIGAAAVVARKIPNNSVAVGNPATVVKSNIEWAV